MVDYSETVAADIKVGIQSKLNEYRKIYQRSRSFFDLCPESLISNIFCSEATGPTD